MVPKVLIDSYDPQQFVVEVSIIGADHALFYLHHTPAPEGLTVAERDAAHHFQLIRDKAGAAVFDSWTDALAIAERYIYSTGFPDEVSGIRVASQ